MKIHKRILNLSAWLALFTIFIFPGNVSKDGMPMTEYGYPFRFFTLIQNSSQMDKWLIKDVYIQLIYYFFDVVIIYWIIFGVVIIKNKLGVQENKKN